MRHSSWTVGIRRTAVNNENIPALIKGLRGRLGLTQEQFAQHLGVTYSTVNHWENGKRIPLPFLQRRLIQMKSELNAQNTKPSRKKR